MSRIGDGPAGDGPVGPPLRVAIVYPHTTVGPDRPPVDALAVLIWELARRLARTEEVEVHVGETGLRPGRRGPDRAEAGEVRIRRHRTWPDQIAGQLRRLDGTLFRDPRRPFRSTRLHAAFFGRQVADAFRRAPPDVVHVHAVPNLVPRIRDALPGARVVFQAHDHRIADYDADRAREMLAPADLLLGCSRFVTGAIARHLPELADRCAPLPNGVDEAFLAVGAVRHGDGDRDGGTLRHGDGDRDGGTLRHGDGDRGGGALRSGPRGRGGPSPGGREGPEVLFVGRLSPEKGVHVLVDAFTRVARAHHGARLTLVGPDEVAPLQFVDPFRSDPRFRSLRDHYRRPDAFAAGLRARVPPSLRDRVRFAGPVPNPDLPARYGRAEVFAFPSIWDEPFGMPVVEAMGAGLPVVATRAGAFPETVVDGETGRLVPPGDVEALAGALDRLLADAALRRAWGRAGHERAREAFDWDRIAGELRRRYRALG